MKRFAHYSLVFSFTMLLWACKKEPLPVAKTESPVFYMSGNAGGTDIRLEAGNQGYRMQPGIRREGATLNVLEADLSNPDCSDCYALKVLINDRAPSAASAAVVIDSALHTGIYPYNDISVSPVEYSMSFRPQKPVDPTGMYRWKVYDGSTETSFTTYDFSCTFRILQNYTVTLEVEDASGCLATHSNVYNLGPAGQVQASAILESPTDLVYKFAPVEAGYSYTSYYWEFGDGTSSAHKFPSHPYEVIGANYYTATLTATDAGNNVSRTTYQVPGTSDPLCVANFSAAITPVQNLQPFSKVIIELKHPSGKLFTTSGFDQPASSVFEVLEVSDYERNSLNQPTKKFRARFSCLLKSDGEELVISNGEAVLAVAYQ